jgi:hypothetical protein
MKRQGIERLIPEIFRRTLRPETPLSAILDVMEALQEPSEKAVASLGTILDPRLSKDHFVPYLACWLDLDRLYDPPPLEGETASARRHSISSGLGRLRELIAEAPYLSHWRGTARGLLRFLVVAIGESGFAIDEAVPGPDGIPQPFHIRVRVPRGAAPHRSLVERIVQLEKPAYVTYEIVLEA